MPSSLPALPLAGGATTDDQLIDSFIAEVRAQHLAEWLPDEPSLILDLKDGDSREIPGGKNVEGPWKIMEHTFVLADA